ncbi:MAG: MauE/DoxX family redox-associated membrane protein [Chitinophagaceae bacterium]
MTHTYTISGMTCKNCVAKVKSQLLSLANIEEADVQLEAPQATISMQKHVAVNELQAAVHKAGNYTITEADGGMKHTVSVSWIATYKPVLLIFAYITGITLLVQAFHTSFSWMVWMTHFMAGFFLVFSFFKLLDLKAFAESYAMYDIVAKKWNAWGYVYPFAELALGIAYLLFPEQMLTSLCTLVIMGISMVGVVQSVLAKRKIPCACLGPVFKLPMSAITIIEDGLMVGMSVIMLAMI